MNSSEMGANAPLQAVPDYPLIYKVVTWVRVLIVVGGLIVAMGWTYQVPWLSYALGAIALNPFAICLNLLAIAGVSYGITWSLTAQITVYADRFEQRKPFIRRVLRLDDIAGRRYADGYPVIVPKTGAAFSIDSTSYGLDERFNHWFLQLGDIEKIAQEQERQRIRNDATLGTNPADRIATNESRRRWFMLFGIPLAVAGFSMFFISAADRQNWLVFFLIDTLLPWVALLLVTIYKDQLTTPIRGELAFVPLAFFFPVLSLGALAADNARIVDPQARLHGVWSWELLCWWPEASFLGAPQAQVVAVRSFWR